MIRPMKIGPKTCVVFLCSSLLISPPLLALGSRQRKSDWTECPRGHVGTHFVSFQVTLLNLPVVACARAWSLILPPRP